MKHFLLSAAFCATLTTPALAQHDHHNHHDHAHHHDHSLHLGSVPAGIMGDHTHPKGKWMASYRFMRMDMNGNRNGTNRLSPTDISGDFANTTGVGPATLRIVPTQMTMDMHMLGGMYGLTDKITLMGMINYIDKDMDHITFAGGDPDLELGRFNTQTKGWGDTKIAALFNIHPKIIAKAGISLPTGSIKERGNILNPMNATQNIRLPYAMQLGSGTYDLEPAITYTNAKGKMNWGTQYNAQIRLGENSQDYSLGDKHRLSIWGGYGWNENITTTLRLSGEHEGKIDGRDTQIAGPVQTADPDNYGGKRIEAGFGVNLIGTKGWTQNQAIAFEATAPIYQNLNGPQMERDYTVTAAYKVGF